MAQQQSSRLNRLLTLLDTGSTLATRRTAAKQIGEIAKARPEDLYALLKKVCPFIQSKNWDTRVAAAAAVGAIAENSNHISVKDLITHAQKCLLELGYNYDLNTILTSNWITRESSSKGLSFRRFDIKKVMDYGAPLLSSGGQEYDVGMDDKTPADRLARQKQMLTRRLGLDVCEQFMDINDMIRDDDIIQRGIGGENGQFIHGGVYHSTEGKQRVQQLVANMVPANFPRRLSARERNLLKRKAKESMKETSKGWGEDDEVDEPSSKRTKSIKPFIMDPPTGDKIMIEAVLDEDTVAQSGEGHWPFGPFVEQLMHDMFDPVWEIRHGSIMALREILSLQASCAAVDVVDLGFDLEVYSKKKIVPAVDDDHNEPLSEMVNSHQKVVSKMVPAVTDDHNEPLSEMVNDHQKVSNVVNDRQQVVSEIVDDQQKIVSPMVYHQKVFSPMIDSCGNAGFELVDNHQRVELVGGHQKVEIVHAHQEVEMVHVHQEVDMVHAHQEAETVHDHQDVGMVHDHQAIDMIHIHQNVGMVYDKKPEVVDDKIVQKVGQEAELVDGQQGESLDGQLAEAVIHHHNVEVLKEQKADMLNDHQETMTDKDYRKDATKNEHQKAEMDNSGQRDEMGYNQQSDKVSSDDQKNEMGDDHRKDEIGDDHRSSDDQKNEIGDDHRKDEMGDDHQKDEMGDDHRKDEMGDDHRKDEMGDDHQRDEMGDDRRSSDDQKNEIGDDHRKDEMGDNHRKDEMDDDHRKDEMGDDHRKDEMGDDHRKDEMGDDHRKDEMEDETGDDHQKGEMGDDHRKDEMGDDHRKDEMEDETGNDHQKGEMGNDHQKDEMIDGDRKVVSPLETEEKIDLNIGLFSEDCSDVKLDYSIVRKDIKLEEECLNSSEVGSPGCMIAKSELDLNEEVKSSIIVDANMGMQTDQLSEKKVVISSMGALSIFPEGSKAIKIFRAVERAWISNTDFLQDCAIRFLCIFSLDRFGDYVSDQVVAPVRETCAQVLGAVLKQMHPFLVHETLSILLQMLDRPEWEVRHGSLLGIKYLVAVRQEMLPQLLPRVLPACINGLEDRDDDVRAVAAEAMTPAAAAIVASGENSVNTILLLLWDILLDLDDLSPSTSSVMHLLAELYTQKDLARKAPNDREDTRPMFDLNKAIQLDDNSEDEIKQMDDPALLSTLTPRLWPFMRHNISSVRHAAISTLERILEASKESESGLSWVVPIVGDALRLVYQNLLLESDMSIVECSKRVWRLLLQIPKDDLASAAEKFFSSWLKLASTATGSPLEASTMFSPTTLPRKSHVRAAAKLRASKGEGSASRYDDHHQNTEIRNADSSFSGIGKVVVGSDTEKSVVQMRVSTAFALGVMASSLPLSLHNMLVEIHSNYLTSPSGVQRQVACMVLASWFRELRKNASDADFCQAVGNTKSLNLKLIKLLSCNDPSTPNPDSHLPYAELARTYTKMRGEAALLLKHAESVGIFLKGPSSPLDTISAENAIDIAMKIAAESTSFHSSGDDNVVESMRQRLLATAGYLKLLQGNLHVSVMASVAGAVVWMGGLPVKLNPVIQPLMAAIKREQEDILQQMAADALAETMSQCVGRKPSPNEKLIKNICSLACADPVETPQATPANAASINLDEIEIFKTSWSRPRPAPMSTAEERSRLEGAITKRGAEFALKFLCSKFEGSLFDKLPKLWDCLTESLNLTSSNGAVEVVASCKSGTIFQHGEPQALINNMQVICSIASVVDKSLETKILMLLPAIFGCVRHAHAAVRLMAARCITAMAKVWREPIMASLLENGAPMLDNALSVEARQGASMLLMLLVEGLQADLVPYAPFLIVPLLGCMSDTDPIVRRSVTYSFAALVPLLPLAKGVAPPPGLNESLLSKSTDDARFLEQLLDNSRVEDYHLAVELKTSLRRYQQEGINWLGFLKRFKLHGILCDDMGLGKTLQASAIVASDIAEHQEAYMSDSEAKLLPSLIICPSTLVGHWVFEIEKFIPTSIINPLQYVGTPQDRIQLQSQIDNYNLIVTSYDVLRKDVDFLSKFVWNFCILDEGHIIKNSKSKLTLAVKQLRAEHRLILSGTPIQNNVLELWSLFDFLMPGFLGTERQFQHMYGKPILAARDAKCSAKEAEAGALAMEALHKQVMPFLLRRTKDDVLADLPPKIIQDRYCDLSPVQLLLYEKFSHSQVKSEVANIVHETGISGDLEKPSSRQPTHVFQALQYLRKLCSHPLLVLDENNRVQLDAIDLDTEKDGKLNLHDLHHSPKLLALKEILEECGIGTQSGNGDSPSYNEGGQHRVLIFAQLKNFLDIIERDLLQTHMKGVTYLRLDGSIEPDKRFDVVKAFNSDPTIDVLLLTTHVGGLGLNLTTADTVVFMEHDWNPMRDLQAMDRAHRLGQKRVVNVHRLIMRGTLEEKVMSLQRFKLSVANTVVNAENASLDKMDTGQLLDLFSMPRTGKSQTKEKYSGKEEDHAIGASTAAGTGKGLKAMLNGLEELWDQSQYSEEYNLDQFVSRLNG